ncbi:MAG TPA: nucleotidyltransferase domain-containing protein [Polyangiaceae bacterium]
MSKGRGAERRLSAYSIEKRRRECSHPRLDAGFDGHAAWDAVYSRHPLALPASTPDTVARALVKLTGALQSLEDVRGLVLYGSLARGEYRVEESDVNLAVSLGRADAATLRALHEPLRVAWRAVRVEPFVVRAAEVPRLAEAFPIKILDIHQHHVVLSGEDPFAGVVVERPTLQKRTEQELRNHLLRLRRHYVFSGDNAALLAKAVYRSTTALRYELGALLYLRGELVALSVPSVLSVAARVLDLDADALARLERFHAGNADADLVQLFRALMTLVERALAAVDAT